MRVWMAGLDLAQLGAAFRGRFLCSTRAWSPLRFRRADYLGPAHVPLDDAVREAVARELGERPVGPVRLLTNLRCLGYVQNPVSFYFCHHADGRLAAVLAEITNTPWGERHHYVVAAPAGGGPLRARFAKAFHVSPFQPMAQTYAWTIAAGPDRIAVHMVNQVAGQPVFDATLVLARRPWCTRNLLAALLRQPWMTARVAVGIYWHAFRLWWKGAPFFVHPRKRVAS